MDTTTPGMNMQGNGGAPQKGGLGSIIGIIIIIAVLVLGGWYFWSMKMAKNAKMDENKAQSGPQIKSSDLSKELDASANANIDAEMKDVNSELSK